MKKNLARTLPVSGIRRPAHLHLARGKTLGKNTQHVSYVGAMLAHYRTSNHLHLGATDSKTGVVVSISNTFLTRAA
jgi:hypothetical protein